MNLAGLDLNATRVRAVSGPAQVAPRPVVLEGNERDLPLAVSLEKRKPSVGKVGLQLCRRLPHLACVNFLADMGKTRTWQAGKHHLTAEGALKLVLERLPSAFTGTVGVGLALPAYLDREQANQLAGLAAKARLPVIGSVTAPLAAAAAAHARHPWYGLALVVDADDHALTVTALTIEDAARGADAGRLPLQHVRVMAGKSWPTLGARIWKHRLIDAIADRCIRQSRRDPRDSADAEQGLYDQLDAGLTACRQGRMPELVIQAEHWYQNLILRADDFPGFCAGLARQSQEAVQSLEAEIHADGPPALVLLTPAASLLPGLIAALQGHIGEQTLIAILPADAVAGAAHELASRWQTNALPRGHYDGDLLLAPTAAQPLPKPGTKRNTRMPGTDLHPDEPEDPVSLTFDESVEFLDP